MADYSKIGDKIIGTTPSVFELVLDDHVPFVDPADYKLQVECVRPIDYFVTSGDAVEKAKVLERDMWALASTIRKLLNNTKNPSNNLKKYEAAVWKSAGLARALVGKLLKAKGENIFLETEWDDHSLLCVPKNPRNRGDNA